MVKRVGKSRDVQPKAAVENNLLSRKLEGFRETRGRLPRKPDRSAVQLRHDHSPAAPTASMGETEFFKNADR